MNTIVYVSLVCIVLSAGIRTTEGCNATVTCDQEGFPGNCCSQYGYCGTGSLYCGAGCTNGPCDSCTMCGQACGGKTCTDLGFPNQCCSQYGWCGTSTDHCGAGCQNGPCGGATTTTTKAPTTTTTTTKAPTTTPAPGGCVCGGACGNRTCAQVGLSGCCSASGQCGTSVSYCGSGCQNGPCISCATSAPWSSIQAGTYKVLPCNTGEIGIGLMRECILNNATSTASWSNITNLCVANNSASQCFCPSTADYPISILRQGVDQDTRLACPGVDYTKNNTNNHPKNRYLEKLCYLTKAYTCAWGPLRSSCCSCLADSGFPETEQGESAVRRCPSSDSTSVNATQSRKCNVNTATGVCSWGAVSDTCNIGVEKRCKCPKMDIWNETDATVFAFSPCDNATEVGAGRVRECTVNLTSNTCMWGNISNYCSASRCNCTADAGWPATQGGVAATLPCQGYAIGERDSARIRWCLWTNETVGVAGNCRWDLPLNYCPPNNTYITYNSTISFNQTMSRRSFTMDQNSVNHYRRASWQESEKYAFRVSYTDKPFSSSTEYPLQGCSSYGSCAYDYHNSSSVAEPHHSRAVQAQCSTTQACSDGSCCSQYGNCGYTSEYCGTGCLRDCNAKPPVTECGANGNVTNCPLSVCCSQWGFCGMTSDFCSTKCQSGCNWLGPPTLTCGGSINTLKIGYYASWSISRPCHQYAPENIDANRYTHLFFAFAQVGADFRIAPSSSSDIGLYRRFTGLKQSNPALKTGISIGGWAFNDPGATQKRFSNLAASASARSTFIQSAISFMNQYGFDGLDIDWEYPGADDRGGIPADTPNYTQLLREIKAAFGSRYFLTIAAPASYWYLRHFEVDRISQTVDWINVMTYDFHGTWDQYIQSLGPYIRAHTSTVDLNGAINLFTKAGAPSNKLVLGLAFYGRSYTLKDPNCATPGCQFSGPAAAGPCTNAAGNLAYFEIKEIIAQQGITPTYNNSDDSVYMKYSGNQWVAFDNYNSIQKKIALATTNCMLGIMMWSVDQDDGLMQSVTSAKSCPQDGEWPSLAAGKTYTLKCTWTTQQRTRSCSSSGSWLAASGKCDVPSFFDESGDGLEFDPSHPPNLTQVGTCWRKSHGRGAGKPVSACQDDYEKSGLLCYPKCSENYYGVGPVCWKNCDPGYDDQGALCYRGSHIFGSDNGGCPWYDKCGLTFKKGCSKCPEGYKNDGCTCRRDVHIYAKSSYGRSAGKVLVCPKELEQNGGLCYPRCENGYSGNGPVCWQNCPPGSQECAAQCVAGTLDCFLNVMVPIVQTVIAAATLATLVIFPPTAGILAANPWLAWALVSVTPAGIIFGNGYKAVC